MPEDYRVRKALESIERDPSRSVLELASLVQLSSSRLGHLFRLQVGTALNHFLRNARLDRAAELLLRTELSIKEITAMVGYHHASSFDRGFRNKFGVSPADYRRKRRLNQVTSPQL